MQLPYIEEEKTKKEIAEEEEKIKYRIGKEKWKFSK